MKLDSRDCSLKQPSFNNIQGWTLHLILISAIPSTDETQLTLTLKIMMTMEY